MSSTHEFYIDGHKLVALAFPSEAAGPPHILIHGITSSVSFWTPDLLAPFLERGPCYSLSLPGHYPAVLPSGFQQDDLTAEMGSRVLAVAIRELTGDRPAVLVGHSTGGFAVLDLAAHTPELAKAVLSIAGFAHGKWTGALGSYQKWVQSRVGRAAFKTLYRLVGAHRALLRASLHIYSPNPRAILRYPHLDDAMDAALIPYRQLDLNAMVCYFAAMPHIDITPLLPRITAPVLALAGTSDPVVPPAQSRLIAEQVTGATLALIDKAGHLPFYENAGAYRQAVEDWLDAHIN
ncbi:MAG: alpha/beta hydrolase [Anaerolineae bacterium]|nr:alpha/beta hydrolase [Anaerolineae bacterium]